MARLPEILTVCGCGFGSSLLLRMSVEDVLAEENLQAKVAAWDTGTAKSQKVDIIVCSIDLVSHLDTFQGRIVAVRDIMNKQEIREKFLPLFHEVLDEIANKKI